MSSKVVHYIDEQPKHRTLSATLNEAKSEFKQFAETRVAMLQAEMKEKMADVKASAPMLAVGALLALTSFLVLTGALICVLKFAFGGSPYGWFFSFLVVGVLYAIIGIATIVVGYEKISKGGLVPKRTLNVLKEDKIWLQNEARNNL
jgi:uncharacterized membrane protein YqjE